MHTAMIFNLFRQSPRDADKIEILYGAIVAQGRAPAFYQNYGVPDTVNGRFEMVVLHTVLVLARLNGCSESLRRLGQAVFDMFCNDMDANLRELGVGDLAVPRKMRQIGEAFYGRQLAYRAAIEANDACALNSALARNVFSRGGSDAATERLGAYVRESTRRLALRDEIALRRGEFGFPRPETISLGEENSR